MGTQGAWGGSGGRDWNKVRNDAADLVENPSGDAAEGVVESLLDALEADEAPEGEGQPVAPPPPAQPSPPVGPARTSSGGSGGGGAGLVFQRPSTSGRSKGGSRRSRAAASRAAGRVIAAGVAARRGDAATLTELGLDLAELQALSPFKRCQKILNVLLGTGAAVEESELREASSPAIRSILIEEADATAAIRIFIVEYAMQIFASEAGEEMRDGSRDGADALNAERAVRSAVEMRVDQIDLPEDSTSPQQLASAIRTALEMMRKVRPGE
jgi:hypothetical protein